MKILLAILGLILPILTTFYEDKRDENQKKHIKRKKITGLAAAVAIIGFVISLTTMYVDYNDKKIQLSQLESVKRLDSIKIVSEKIKAEEKFILLKNLVEKGIIKLDTVQKSTDTAFKSARKVSNETLGELKKTYNELPTTILCDLKLKVNYSTTELQKLDSIFRNLNRKPINSHFASDGQLVNWRSGSKDSIYNTLKNITNGEIKNFKLTFVKENSKDKISYLNEKMNVASGRIDNKGTLIINYDSTKKEVTLNLKGLLLNLKRGLEMTTLTDLYKTNLTLTFNQLPYFSSNSSINEKAKIKYFRPMNAIELKLYTITGQKLIIKNLTGNDRTGLTKNLIEEIWED